MQSKEKNNKTTCTKSKEAEVRLPAEKVAEMTGVSKSLVKQIRSGKKRSDTPSGERVEVAEELWASGSNLLINEIKKIVKL